MITLAAAGTLQGLASVAASVTYTLSGLEIASNVETFKVLAQGQLPSSVAALYTVPASTIAMIKSLLLANTTAGIVSITLFVNGTGVANQICSFPIPAHGGATFDVSGWKVYDANGALTLTTSIGSYASRAKWDIN